MFVLKKTHEAVASELRRQIGVLTDNKRRMAESMEGEARHLRRQLDKALAELAPLKARALAQEEGRRRATAASAAKRAQKKVVA